MEQQEIVNQVVIRLDEQNRILKYCVGGHHWQVATPEHFPVVKRNLDRICYDCRRKSQQEWFAKRMDSVRNLSSSG